MSTIFTKIIKEEIPGYKILEDDTFCAFLDAFPVQRGHTLVVPKREVDYIFDLSDTELSEMIAFAKRVAQAIQKATGCRKVALSVIGLEVPHAHIHLVPINSEGDLDFKAEKLKVTPAEQQEIQQAIKQYL